VRLLLLLVTRGAELGVPAAHCDVLAISVASRTDLKRIMGVSSAISTVGTTTNVLTVEVADLGVLESKGIPVSITIRLIIADDHLCEVRTE
jgi:hypothetical protein